MGGNGLSRWWGPVFEAERTTQSRRWQGYALRSVFVFGLLVGLILAGRKLSGEMGEVTVRQMAQVGSTVTMILTILELLAALVIAPATTAGAICIDKSRGSLAHLFTTDLSNREIVLGKLAARLFPVWGLLACTFPMVALSTWLGGIDPADVTRAALVVMGVAFLGCTFALMLSVWATRPHEVISVVYGIWAFWLLDWPVYNIILGTSRAPPWIEWTNPFFLILGHNIRPWEYFTVPSALFCLGCLVTGSIFTAVAIAKVRVVGCRSPRIRVRVRPQRVGKIRREIDWMKARIPRRKGISLDANPVLWREWHRNRPGRWSRRIWVGFWGLSALVGLTLVIGAVVQPTSRRNEAPGILLAVLAVFGLLLVGAATPSVLAEERIQGSLDVLMSTPVSTRTILRAKWRGAFRRVPALAVWPVVIGLIYAIILPFNLAGLGIFAMVPIGIIAQGAAVVSLGLALATWIKRTGQATAWTVGALVVSVVGWPILGANLQLTSQTITVNTNFGPELSNSIKRWLLYMGSPFFDTGFSLDMAINRIDAPSNDILAILIMLTAWTAFYALAAWVLFELTVLTFDRCLGRAPERPRKPLREPTVPQRDRQPSLIADS